MYTVKVIVINVTLTKLVLYLDIKRKRDNREFIKLDIQN